MNFDPRESYRTKVLYGFTVVILVGAAVGAVTVSGVSETVHDERTATVTAEATIQADIVSQLLSDTVSTATQLADTTGRVREQTLFGLAARRELGTLYTRQVSSSSRVGEVHLVNESTGEPIVSTAATSVAEPETTLSYDVPLDLADGETAIAVADSRAKPWVVFVGTSLGDTLVVVTSRTGSHDAV